VFDSAGAFETKNGIQFVEGVGIYSGPDLSPVNSDISNAPAFSTYYGPDGSRWFKRSNIVNDWAQAEDTYWNPALITRRECPWITSSTGGEINFTSFGIGNVTKLNEASPTTQIIGSISISANPQGYQGIQQAINEINLGSLVKMTQFWRIAQESLWTLTQQFIQSHGFMDEITGLITVTDGAWFEYNGLLGPNWICKTSSLLSVTSVITSVVVDLNYHDFVIVKDKNSNSVSFFIDSALVATITTKITKILCRNTGIVARIIKTLGGNPASFKIDHYADEMDLR
jgi:hypothetical protein